MYQRVAVYVLQLVKSVTKREKSFFCLSA